MQTFLPYADFDLSAQALDRQRLGKQRVENLQILKALLIGGGWQNHPAVRMWRGYEGSLLQYQIRICAEWSRRGYADTCLAKSLLLADGLSSQAPPWLGRQELHLSHQSNLVRKDPQHYGPMFPNVGPDLAYYWPQQ
jgi:hypothetical protein